MKILMKIRVLEKANELINLVLSLSNVLIACLMLRPLGSNIEFSMPTARCQSLLNVWLTLHKVSYLKTNAL